MRQVLWPRSGPTSHPVSFPIQTLSRICSCSPTVEQTILGQYERSGHLQCSSRPYPDRPIVAGPSPTVLKLISPHFSLRMCSVCPLLNMTLLYGIVVVAISLLRHGLSTTQQTSLASLAQFEPFALDCRISPRRVCQFWNIARLYVALGQCCCLAPSNQHLRAVLIRVGARLKYIHIFFSSLDSC